MICSVLCVYVCVLVLIMPWLRHGLCRLVVLDGYSETW